MTYANLAVAISERDPRYVMSLEWNTNAPGIRATLMRTEDGQRLYEGTAIEMFMPALDILDGPNDEELSHIASELFTAFWVLSPAKDPKTPLLCHFAKAGEGEELLWWPAAAIDNRTRELVSR